ncbi:DUF7524 family protein [Halospeciosus flavus]|uniref:PGF-pre-PGF domain-containing protein n=1 Tax=Halospeciosus flavus TaxID=3032283 RepID=A0ABD5Z2C4_9EURY|nr:hypothetical protein [Halospeciosus flavus]
MPGTLTVHVNHDGTNSVSAERSSFETAGAFDVVLVNEGTPAHVHVRLDDALSRVASLDTTNVYLDADSSQVVHVRVGNGGERPVTGTLEVVTGYGAETEPVEVTVTDPTAENPPVAVDESLGSPQPEEEDQGVELGDVETLVPLLLVSIGLLVTVLAFLTVGDVLATFVAAVVLLGGLSAALFLRRQA